MTQDARSAAEYVRLAKRAAHEAFPEAHSIAERGKLPRTLVVWEDGRWGIWDPSDTRVLYGSVMHAHCTSANTTSEIALERALLASRITVEVVYSRTNAFFEWKATLADTSTSAHYDDGTKHGARDRLLDALLSVSA